MTAQRPTHAQLKEVVAELSMSMTDDRIQDFLDVMQGTLDAYDAVDAMPDNLPPVKYPRGDFSHPPADDNPYNAWYVRTEIRGAADGPLSGRTVALKDNVCLAGVPMMNGASTLQGLHTRCRRDHRHPPARRRRDHRRQGALRVFLPLRRQPYQRSRSGGKPAQARLLSRRLLVGLGGAGSGRRGRHGDRRRSGRLDQDPVLL